MIWIGRIFIIFLLSYLLLEPRKWFAKNKTRRRFIKETTCLQCKNRNLIFQKKIINIIYTDSGLDFDVRKNRLIKFTATCKNCNKLVKEIQCFENNPNKNRSTSSPSFIVDNEYNPENCNEDEYYQEYQEYDKHDDDRIREGCIRTLGFIFLPPLLFFLLAYYLKWF